MVPIVMNGQTASSKVDRIVYANAMVMVGSHFQN
eukprot:CAMPEP_0178996060 /NCGR_PEP_ID=MMETSP0795-20121207/8163_1 /TAXON_ID=88552 /ORGANISM="Amoebophrya sp., Strain Ameob2" /LENGTH=33 /DNA_ID= /DNA_START= /DNA_END= /DNA_ORIENTATION=